ncbi:MAG: Cystinosin/ERS1p repeat protein [Rhodospirillaceae bacterium]|nr:MAG: Cystinosin/ERS1p repeat protein [Rhodospirillaceae bacterium]
MSEPVFSDSISYIIDLLVKVDSIGYIAGLLTTIAFLPQVIKTWRSRSARDLSLAMLLIFTTGVFCWLLYGIAINRWPIIIPNVITFALTSTILFFKVKKSARS